jgi:alcohol dehydrogenase YqhD (iron-dependent ADH family)
MQMAVVIVSEMAQGNQEIYDRVTSKVMPQNELPDGCILHIAGPGEESGWRVITVWESDEQFNRFREEQLVPAIREVAGEQAVAPQITTKPVHRLIKV